ncbi:uncharacterized protein N7473_003564 [Penicillium subrubescens]|jgi:hypothetical protein|uniref:uncharacterized protein n=1 Tax=Penicillium subrubescens TaxID=1316194 RepID=UPI002544F947|nr:uncharacterized protein N7473_003564 [Penicillium subrubescens]KAJ5906648.1 hypothetical protein N7473_003564 [Penicillium subrubescens]
MRYRKRTRETESQDTNEAELWGRASCTTPGIFFRPSEESPVRLLASEDQSPKAAPDASRKRQPALLSLPWWLHIATFFSRIQL